MTSPHLATPRRAIAAVVASLTLIIGVLYGAPAHAGATVRLADGHTDIFNVDAANGSGLRMKVKEDITGHGVLREPEDVILVVNEQARTTMTGAFAQFGQSAYVLPLVQQPGLLWPGWDTQGVVGGGFGAVDIHFDSVTGPGKVFLATQGSGLGGGIAPLLSDGSFEITGGSVRHQDPPAHTHAYWVFTAPGTYTMTVRATAGGVSSGSHTYTWQVGDVAETNPEPAPDTDSAAPTTAAPSAINAAAAQTATAQTATAQTATPDPLTTTAPSATSTTTAPTTKTAPPVFNAIDDPWLNSPAADAGSSSGLSSSSKEHRRVVVTTVTRARTVADPATLAPANPTPASAAAPAPASAPTCHPVNSEQPRLVPTLRDDRVSPARLVDPASVEFALGQASTATTHQQIGSIPADTPVWMIGATQVRDVPWLGVNTMEPDLLAATNQPIVFSLTGFSGPGDMEVFTSGNFGTVVGEQWFSAVAGQPSGSVSINPNTHVHPNWVFTRPGTYVLTITQDVTLHDGRHIQAPTTLTLHVGSGQGITSGHFDLGSTVVNGTTTTLVDDAGRPCGTADVTPRAGATPQAGGFAPAAPVAPTRGAGTLARTGLQLLDGPLGFAGLSIALLGSAVIWSTRRRSQSW